MKYTITFDMGIVIEDKIYCYSERLIAQLWSDFWSWEVKVKCKATGPNIVRKLEGKILLLGLVERKSLFFNLL